MNTNHLQLELFENKPVFTKVKKTTYSDLSIHQKINYKANQCGFQGIVYKSRYNYFHRSLIKAKTDYLTKEYQWHYDQNSGNNNRIDTWRKENQSKLIFA